MRDRARVVIVGGGVGGASIAYHLAERGERDVLLIERAELTSGSTFHSAGLVGQLRSTLPVTRMMMHSVELYRRLEADAATTGRSPGWREVGSLRIASTPARMEELRRQHGWATTFGLPLELLGPTECGALFPPMVLDGVLGGVYLPTDGHVDPSGLTLALVGAARDQGIEVAQGVRVEGFAIVRGRCTGVLTDHGPVETEAVVLACGMYTPELALRAGVDIPIVPMAHQYVITEPIDGVSDALTQLRDPDNLVYFRREGAGLCLGRLRAATCPVGRRRRARRLQRTAAARGLGSVRATHGQRVFPGARRGGGRDPPPGERPGRLHTGQRVHPRRNGAPGPVRGGRVLRPRDRRRRRCRPSDGRVGSGRATRTGRVAHGHPPLRSSVREPRPGRRPRRRGVLDLLRHPLSRRGAPVRTPPAALSGLRAPCRIGLRIRREEPLGASELVRTQCLPGRGGGRGPASTPWLGGGALESRDRRGGTRLSRQRGALRRNQLLEARGPGSRGLGVHGARLRQRDGSAGRRGDLHAVVQRARRDRVRSHRHPA